MAKMSLESSRTTIQYNGINNNYQSNRIKVTLGKLWTCRHTNMYDKLILLHAPTKWSAVFFCPSDPFNRSSTRQHQADYLSVKWLQITYDDIGSNEKLKGVRGSAGVTFLAILWFCPQLLKSIYQHCFVLNRCQKESWTCYWCTPMAILGNSFLEIWPHNWLVLQLTIKISGLNFDLERNSWLFKPGHVWRWMYGAHFLFYHTRHTNQASETTPVHIICMWYVIIAQIYGISGKSVL